MQSCRIDLLTRCLRLERWLHSMRIERNYWRARAQAHDRLIARRDMKRHMRKDTP